MNGVGHGRGNECIAEPGNRVKAGHGAGPGDGLGRRLAIEQLITPDIGLGMAIGVGLGLGCCWA